MFIYTLTNIYKNSIILDSKKYLTYIDSTIAGYIATYKPCLNYYVLMSFCLTHRACTVASQREPWSECCQASGQAFLD